MKNSTMKSKLYHFLLHRLFPVVFWLAVWEIAAGIINHSYFLPGLWETLLAIKKIITEPGFLKIVSNTLLRIFAGIASGTLLATVFAILSHRFRILYSLISPINSVIKATPVASIIILLWISMNGNSLAIFVSFLMVFPIIWQNLYDAFSSIDNRLIEVAEVFQFNYRKRLCLLVFPALKQYFLPAFVTAIGLAFKAEIAAERIAGVRNSIGQMIYYAKDAPAIDEMFAWTAVGVSLSITIEKLAKSLLLPKNRRKGAAEI